MNQEKDPLYGVTFKALLIELVDEYGWEKLGAVINIRCFNHDPSIGSSLKFLRRTYWARAEVENFYINHYKKKK